MKTHLDYGKEADIYSLGVTFLEMYHPPFRTIPVSGKKQNLDPCTK